MQVGESNSRVGDVIDVSVGASFIAQLEHFCVGIIQVDQDDIGLLGAAVFAQAGKRKQETKKQSKEKRHFQSLSGFALGFALLSVDVVEHGQFSR